MPLIEEMEISAMYDGTVAVIAPQPSPVSTRPASRDLVSQLAPNIYMYTGSYTYKKVGHELPS